VDVARVLRMPGFFNHKYGRPHFVTIEKHSAALSLPEHFPAYSDEERSARSLISHRGDLPDSMQHAPPLSQSELDWAYVQNALREGKSPNDLIAELGRVHTTVAFSCKMSKWRLRNSSTSESARVCRCNGAT
jgi:hypothetical protein